MGRAERAGGRVRAWVVAATAIAAAIAVVAPAIGDRAEASEPRRFLLATEAEILALPTSGPAWDALRAAADQPLTADLSNQDDLSPSRALAAGLVYVRTGTASYRDRVVAALRALPGTEIGGRTLSLGRQLAGWVLAADLVGHRDPSFVAWLTDVRTTEIGGHGRWVALTQTHEATSSNWGAFAGASRLAASLYLGDAADVARAAQVFRGWLGDGAAWPTLAVGASGSGFLPTADFDASWACAYPDWTPVNAGCGDRSGALVEDISRGDAYPAATQVGLSYSWEALQGATLQAILLGRNGYPDVWTWQGAPLSDALTFLAAHGGFDATNFNRVNHWVPAAIDQVYGTSRSTGPAGSGRNFGFTDWLPVRPTAPAATTTTTSSTTTTAPAPTTTASTAPAPTTTTTAPATTTTTAPAPTRTRVRIAHQECEPGPVRCRQSAVTEA
jgi:hypothetical protein